ncbi:MAG TPA: Mur ligase family protein, partial [Ilumatobacteraceae bacterium]|nr:Mur ligase family protein [Ilumatobacteraceae bacterium]
MTPRLATAIAWLEQHIDDAGWAARANRAGPIELSLTRMHALADALGNPQHRLRTVHITGTNGKGSTAAIVTRLLLAEGRRVGTYTSPHLSRYNERIQVDDTPIGDDTFADLLERVAAAEAAIGQRSRPFELLTAAALCHFADQKVDVAVIEVGMLGRFDATNVVDADVAVITNIGFDHTTGEGDWRHRIVAEKAGIVTPRSVAILGPIEDRLAAVVATERPRALWRFGRDITVTRDVAIPTG